MKLSKKLGALLGIGALSLGLLVAGCGGDSAKKEAPKATTIEGKVTAQGSTALLPLLKIAQEQFEGKNPKVTINITGGGSFTGMNQVANKAVDIGNSDVELPKELADKGLVDHKVTVMPFVFITNPDVKTTNLSQQQAIDILTGKITNWKDVGGADQKITIIHRAKSSGSRATIAKIVLNNQNFTDNAVILDSNGAVKAAIATTAGAIGYVDVPYVDKTVNMLSYNGVAYSEQAVTSGKYPVYAYGHMYTNGAPTGATKAFIDFILSKDFQVSASPKGFIPVTKMSK